MSAIFGKSPTGYGLEVQELERKLKRLELENRRLKAALATKSWEGSVDRQGGSFSQDEIDNATTWR